MSTQYGRLREAVDNAAGETVNVYAADINDVLTHYREICEAQTEARSVMLGIHSDLREKAEREGGMYLHFYMRVCDALGMTPNAYSVTKCHLILQCNPELTSSSKKTFPRNQVVTGFCRLILQPNLVAFAFGLEVGDGRIVAQCWGRDNRWRVRAERWVGGVGAGGKAHIQVTRSGRCGYAPGAQPVEHAFVRNMSRGGARCQGLSGIGGDRGKGAGRDVQIGARSGATGASASCGRWP